MRFHTFFRILASASALLLGVGIATAQIVNTTHPDNSPYATIQAAIDDPITLDGDVITVAAGTYEYRQTINIYKSVTLRGPNAGISPNDPADPLNPNPNRVPEAVLQSGNHSVPQMTLNAPAISIEGFKFTGSNLLGDIRVVHLVEGTSHAIRWNFFQARIGYAVYAPADGREWVVSENRVQGCQNTAFNFGGYQYHSHIEGNVVLGVVYGDGMRIDGPAEICEVTGNVIHTARGCGIVIGEVVGGDYTANTIVNVNTARNPEMGGIVLSCLHSDRWDATFMSYNRITGCYNGIVNKGVEYEFGRFLTVEQNDLSGNESKAIVNTGVNLLPATCNWYGTTDPVAVAASVSGLVTYEPFLVSGVDNDPLAAGFQPIPGSCTGGCRSPSLSAIAAPSTPVVTNTPIAVSAALTDPDLPNDVHTAVWDWGDATTSDGAVSENTVVGNHTYATAGVYTVGLTVTDNCGLSASATYQYVVVYDPSAGFVTGGGWITSPPGAYPADPSLTGRAIFGFTSKYQRGSEIPSGNTVFHFRIADLRFNSTAYDWLVVAGARAKLKGVGTINGAGNLGFMLTAIDGEISGGGGSDKFRIKIWDRNTNEVVYDNQIGMPDGDDPTTVIGDGAIVIHSGTRKEFFGDLLPTAFALHEAYPNPFNPSTTIRYALPTGSQITLTVFNTLGQQMATLVEGEKEAGYHEVRFDAAGLPSGVYFYRLTAGTFSETRKLLLLR